MTQAPNAWMIRYAWSPVKSCLAQSQSSKGGTPSEGGCSCSRRMINSVFSVTPFTGHPPRAQTMHHNVTRTRAPGQECNNPGKTTRHTSDGRSARHSSHGSSRGRCARRPAPGPPPALQGAGRSPAENNGNLANHVGEHQLGVALLSSANPTSKSMQHTASFTAEPSLGFKN